MATKLIQFSLAEELLKRLAAAALNTNIPTEEEILRLIRLKQGKRWSRQWLRELRSSGEGCKD